MRSRFVLAAALFACAVIIAPTLGCRGSSIANPVNAANEPNAANAPTPLPTPPPADAPVGDRYAYEELKLEIQKLRTETQANLDRLAVETLAKIEADPVLTPEQRAEISANVRAALDQFRDSGSGSTQLPPLPVGGGPPAWALWGLGALTILLGGGAGKQALDTRRLRAALEAYQRARYEGVVNGSVVSLTEGELVAAAAAALGKIPAPIGVGQGITRIDDTPDLPIG